MLTPMDPAQRQRVLVGVACLIPLEVVLTFLGMRDLTALDLVVAALLAPVVAGIFVFLARFRIEGAAARRRTWIFAGGALAAGMLLDRLTGHSHEKGALLVGALWGFGVFAVYAFTRNRSRERPG